MELIDLHSHVLPNMDDGSASVEESAALLKMLEAQGVRTVVATPHFYPIKDTPGAFLARRQDCVNRLAGVETGLRLMLGAEVAYFSGIANSAEIEALRIGDTKLLLVEMPFCDWNDAMVEEVCSLPERRGLYPVLAHIHRYCGRNQLKKYAEKLLARGVYFQCSPEGFLQGWHKRWILGLVKKGEVHFLGSDCHNLHSRPPMMDQVDHILRQKLGDLTVEVLHSRAAQLLDSVK